MGSERAVKSFPILFGQARVFLPLPHHGLCFSGDRPPPSGIYFGPQTDRPTPLSHPISSYYCAKRKILKLSELGKENPNFPSSRFHDTRPRRGIKLFLNTPVGSIRDPQPEKEEGKANSSSAFPARPQVPLPSFRRREWQGLVKSCLLFASPSALPPSLRRRTARTEQWRKSEGQKRFSCLGCAII